MLSFGAHLIAKEPVRDQNVISSDLAHIDPGFDASKGRYLEFAPMRHLHQIPESDHGMGSSWLLQPERSVLSISGIRERFAIWPARFIAKGIQRRRYPFRDLQFQS